MATTVTPAGDGMTTFVLTVIFLFLCWTTVIARVTIRLMIKACGVDDWLMVLGLIMFTACAGVLIAYCFYGGGYHIADIEPTTALQAYKYYFICQTAYCPTTIPIKLSICVSYARIAGTQRRFIYAIYAIGGTAIVAGLGAMIGILASCSPPSAFWDVTAGTCNPTVNTFAGYLLSASSIITDFSLAILPAVMLWKVQLIPAIKFTVIILLSLAALASCATIVRLRYLLVLLGDKDKFLYGSAKITYWTVVEAGIGIFAGSLPALRPLLRYIPGIRTHNSEKGIPGGTPGSISVGGNLRGTSDGTKKSFATVKMNTFKRVSRAGDEYLTLSGSGDGDSQKYILNEDSERCDPSEIGKHTSVTVARIDREG